MLVYVINKHGEPLMPCKPRKARVLLKEKKAKVVKKEPFTIQLLYGTSGHKQDITLNVNPGSKSIGLSATTETKELFKDTIEIKQDVSKPLKNHRNKRKRYKAPKTKNRQNKTENQTTIVKEICEILPVTNIKIKSKETQNVKNPDVSGVNSHNSTKKVVKTNNR